MVHGTCGIGHKAKGHSVNHLLHFTLSLLYVTIRDIFSTIFFCLFQCCCFRWQNIETVFNVDNNLHYIRCCCVALNVVFQTISFNEMSTIYLIRLLSLQFGLNRTAASIFLQRIRNDFQFSFYETRSWPCRCQRPPHSNLILDKLEIAVWLHMKTKPWTR